MLRARRRRRRRRRRRLTPDGEDQKDESDNEAQQEVEVDSREMVVEEIQDDLRCGTCNTGWKKARLESSCKQILGAPDEREHHGKRKQTHWYWNIERLCGMAIVLLTDGTLKLWSLRFFYILLIYYLLDISSIIYHRHQSTTELKRKWCHVTYLDLTLIRCQMVLTKKTTPATLFFQVPLVSSPAISAIPAKTKTPTQTCRNPHPIYGQVLVGAEIGHVYGVPCPFLSGWWFKTIRNKPQIWADKELNSI